MVSFGIIFKYVLLFIMLMIPGYLVGKLRRPDPRGIDMTSSILTDIAMPFLVFSSFLKTDITSLRVSEVVISLLLPFAIVGITLLVTLVLFKKREGIDTGKVLANRYCAIIPNCGFLGLPLAMAVFGADSRIAVLISLFNVANTYIILTVGGYILSGETKFSLKKLLLSPVNFAILLGVVFSLMDIGVKFPMVISYADYLASLTTPLSMTVLGYELSKLKLPQIVKNPAMYVASLVKLVICPVTAMAILLLLRTVFAVNIGFELAAAIFISSAVSTAATSPSLAAKFGADSEQAAVVTLGTTILCVITLPLLYIICNFLF